MQLGDLTLGERQEPHAGEAEVLVKRGDVFLVTRKTIKCFGHHDLEGAASGILEQILVAGPEPDRAAHRVITVGGNQLPALGFNARLAGPDLVLNGGCVLEIGRESGIDGDAHDGHSFLSSLPNRAQVPTPVGLAILS
jgi:hypothetical protein